jgi:hypothetical protein
VPSEKDLPQVFGAKGNGAIGLFCRHFELLYEEVPKLLIRRYLVIGELIFDVFKDLLGQVIED